MSRADVPIDATPGPPVWHRWRRTGPTLDHRDSDGQNWPTVAAVCVHCQEHRMKVPVAWLEGTAGDIPREVWPGKCNLGRRGPADTDWVSMTTESTIPTLGSFGRGLVRAFAWALLWAYLPTVYLTLVAEFPRWVWVPAFAALGLAGGLLSATEDPSKKRPKKG